MYVLKTFFKMEEIIYSFCLNTPRSCCSTEKIKFPHRASKVLPTWCSCSLLALSLHFSPCLTGSLTHPFSFCPWTHLEHSSHGFWYLSHCLELSPNSRFRFWKSFIILACVWIVSILRSSLIPPFSSSIVFQHYPTWVTITSSLLRYPYFLMFDSVN